LELIFAYILQQNIIIAKLNFYSYTEIMPGSENSTAAYGSNL